MEERISKLALEDTSYIDLKPLKNFDNFVMLERR